MLKPCEYCKKEAIHGVSVTSDNASPIGTYYFCDWECLRYLLETAVSEWKMLEEVLGKKGADNG